MVHGATLTNSGFSHALISEPATLNRHRRPSPLRAPLRAHANRETPSGGVGLPITRHFRRENTSGTLIIEPPRAKARRLPNGRWPIAPRRAQRACQRMPFSAGARSCRCATSDTLAVEELTVAGKEQVEIMIIA